MSGSSSRATACSVKRRAVRAGVLRVHTHMHTHTYIHTHTLTHSHTQTHRRWGRRAGQRRGGRAAGRCGRHIMRDSGVHARVRGRCAGKCMLAFGPIVPAGWCAHPQLPCSCNRQATQANCAGASSLLIPCLVLHSACCGNAPCCLMPVWRSAYQRLLRHCLQGSTDDVTVVVLRLARG